MATTTIARRSNFIRTIWRTTTQSSPKFSNSSPPISMLRHTRISPHLSRFGRELSSLLPMHSATASACLVSKLPTGVNHYTQSRFANYVSPI